MIGLPQEIYTPIFAMARIVGWTAHRIEELNFEVAALFVLLTRIFWVSWIILHWVRDKNTSNNKYIVFKKGNASMSIALLFGVYRGNMLFFLAVVFFFDTK